MRVHNRLTDTALHKRPSKISKFLQSQRLIANLQKLVMHIYHQASQAEQNIDIVDTSNHCTLSLTILSVRNRTTKKQHKYSKLRRKCIPQSRKQKNNLQLSQRARKRYNFTVDIKTFLFLHKQQNTRVMFVWNANWPRDNSYSYCSSVTS
jgi:hypothetical protein